MEAKPEMELCVFQALGGIEIPVQAGTSFTFTDEFKVSNDPELLKEIRERFLVPTLNRQLAAATTPTKTFAYFLRNYAEGRMTDENIAVFLNVFVSHADLLFLGLWAIRDNSVNPGQAFLVTRDAQGTRLQNHPLVAKYTNATRDVVTTQFSREEITKAAEIADRITALLPTAPMNDLPKSSFSHPSRFGRAMSFLQATRTSGDLALKIVFYCTALEALFSTSNEEVAHQISERLALFIGKDGEEQQTIYLNTKRLYTLRSRAVHGSPVPIKDDDDFPRLIAGDDYLRRAVLRILDSTELSESFTKATEKEMQAYFLNELFPKNSK